MDLAKSQRLHSNRESGAMDPHSWLQHDVHAPSFPSEPSGGREVLTGLPMLLSGTSDTKVVSIQGAATDEPLELSDTSYGLDPWHISNLPPSDFQCQGLQGRDPRRCSMESATTEPSDTGGGRDSVFSITTDFGDSWLPGAATSSGSDLQQWRWDMRRGGTGMDRRSNGVDIVGDDASAFTSRGPLPAPPGLLQEDGLHSRMRYEHELAKSGAISGAAVTRQPMYNQYQVVPGVGASPYYNAPGWPLGCGHLDSMHLLKSMWPKDGSQPSSGLDESPSMHWQQQQSGPTPPFLQPEEQPGGLEVRTTVMLRNLPEGFTREMLTAMLNDQGFTNVYDFIYMPMNFRTRASFGYAFVNLVCPDDAERCHEKLEGFIRWHVPTDKICEVSWSDMHQGLAAHVERYRNSPVMHESVPDEYKPVMYSCGVRVTFPPPTKKLRVPRIRRSSDSDRPEDDQGLF